MVTIVCAKVSSSIVTREHYCQLSHDRIFFFFFFFFFFCEVTVSSMTLDDRITRLIAHRSAAPATPQAAFVLAPGPLQRRRPAGRSPDPLPWPQQRGRPGAAGRRQDGRLVAGTTSTSRSSAGRPCIQTGVVDAQGDKAS